MFYTHYAVVYQDVRLTILNRWGNKVIDIPQYDNTWSGTDKSGDKLESGTYFYFLSYDEGQQNFEGIIQLIDSSN